jgi:hypothetical protein
MPVSWLARRTAGAVQAGFDLEDLLQRAYIRLGDEEAVDLSMAQLYLLTNQIIRALDDETHGFARARFRRGHSAVLATSLLDRSTVGDALNRIIRYFELTASPFSIALQETRLTATISMRVEARSFVDAAMIEDSWATFVYQMLSWFAGRRLPLFDFQVRLPDHPAIGRSHLLLQCPTVLGEVTRIRLPAHILRAPRRVTPSANPYVDVLSGWMALDGTSAPEAASRAARVARIVAAATQLLVSSDDPLERVAQSLGYSEARSLRRLIKQQTGKTPQEIRETGRAPVAALDHGGQLAAQAKGRLLELLADPGF